MKENVVVIDPGFAAQVIPVTDTLWSDIDSRFGDFAGRVLVSRFEFDSDWPTWEVNPAGNKPGEFVIVPRNTWHTAKVGEPTAMLFVTPGEGTINAGQPERG